MPLCLFVLLDAEILHAQLADRHGHPAILIAVIVDAAHLTRFPADGDDFEEIAFVNQIPCVVTPGIEEIRLETFPRWRGFLDERFDARES